MSEYCVKCKTKTGTKNVTRTTSKKGQPMLKGKCVVCNTNKCSFIKKNR